MNKQDLIKKIDSTWLSAKRKTELKEAVNNFEDALLRQYAVSGRSEQFYCLSDPSEGGVKRCKTQCKGCENSENARQ